MHPIVSNVRKAKFEETREEYERSPGSAAQASGIRLRDAKGRETTMMGMCLRWRDMTPEEAEIRTRIGKDPA